ncbi:hypothetical protein FLONG3_2004 [Fusarium longipes]|uniref:Uncharacterized protein n=1 Tax=Fusarium longipes TaxID=694270 RepID=A0A395T506_9HYPO|nr:hypothetical protein FLONG3_2004 [Fusarium longipes]
MKGERGTNTKKDTESQGSLRETRNHASRTPGLGLRPGRNPANREINLGLRRSQRLQTRQEDLLRDVSHTGERRSESISVDSQVNRPEEQQAIASSPSETVTQMPSCDHALPKRDRRLVPPDWEPPLVIGASLGTNLSRMEEAERSALQWEAVVANTRRIQPLADLSGLERQRDKARQKLEQMEESDENMVPVDELESTKRQRICKRIDLLTASLERNECPDGDTNIRAAINAYQIGQIKCWDKWTLIYASQYGEGWLWYEPPLALAGAHQTEQLMAATWAQPSVESGLLSEYNPYAWEISMGFKRVRGFHSRVSQRLSKLGLTKKGKVLMYQTKLREFGSNERGTCFVEDEDEETTAPRVCFKMLLDSGATHPSLHNSDLQYLGIDRKTYPAQTHVAISTAESSTAVARVYEMRIDVCRHNGESLVGDDPVFPNERRELGGIAPVMVLVSSTPDESEPLSEWYDEALKNGEDVSEEATAQRYKGPGESRLSGMFPFQVCYFAGVPGKSVFWFGEDRRDVLGADRMPGQQRWERHLRAKGVQRPDETSHLGRPTVAFHHQMDGLKLVDTDSTVDPGTSFLTIDNAKGARQVVMKVGEDPEEKDMTRAPKRKIQTGRLTNVGIPGKRMKTYQS